MMTDIAIISFNHEEKNRVGYYYRLFSTLFSFVVSIIIIIIIPIIITAFTEKSNLPEILSPKHNYSIFTLMW